MKRDKGGIPFEKREKTLVIFFVLNPPEKTPEVFEMYLPYALAMDLEQQWATVVTPRWGVVMPR